MNIEFRASSIYSPKKRQKEILAFPKILKNQITHPDSKVFTRGVNRKYNHQNIFKIQDQKRQKVKLFIQQQRQKQSQLLQYKQLEQKMNELMIKHEEQIRQLQKREQSVKRQMEKLKRGEYQIKLNLWQTKNEVMNLVIVCTDEQKQYERLAKELGYEQEEQYQEQERDFEEVNKQEVIEQIDIVHSKNNLDIINEEQMSLHRH